MCVGDGSATRHMPDVAAARSALQYCRVRALLAPRCRPAGLKGAVKVPAELL